MAKICRWNWNKKQLPVAAACTKKKKKKKNRGSLGDSRDYQQKYGVIGWQQRWKSGVFGALFISAFRGGAIGGKGGQKPPKDFKKREKWKNMGYFHASKLSKLAFLSSLTMKNVLWKGFYHYFSTKKASASGGFASLTPTKGLCPLDPPPGALPPGPEVPSPP